MQLGLSHELLKHGLQREAFLFPLIENLQDYLEEKSLTPSYFTQPFDDLAEWWRERWLLPRAERIDGWHSWEKEAIKQMLIQEGTIDGE